MSKKQIKANFDLKKIRGFKIGYGHTCQVCDNVCDEILYLYPDFPSDDVWICKGCLKTLLNIISVFEGKRCDELCVGTPDCGCYEGEEFRNRCENYRGHSGSHKCHEVDTKFENFVEFVED